MISIITNKLGEVDLLTHRGSTVTQLIQVMYQGLDDPEIMQREINALCAAQKTIPAG